MRFWLANGAEDPCFERLLISNWQGEAMPHASWVSLIIPVILAIPPPPPRREVFQKTLHFVINKSTGGTPSIISIAAVGVVDIAPVMRR